MKLRSLLIAVAFAPLLSGCALLAQTGLEDDALNATNATLRFYGDVVQPGVITFGRIPTCPQPVVALCKDPATWTRIQATDATVTAAIVRARAALNGSVPNSGQAAAAVSAINNSLVVYSGAGVKLAQ